MGAGERMFLNLRLKTSTGWWPACHTTRFPSILKTRRDLILLTRAFGCKYVWIDALLCILKKISRRLDSGIYSHGGCLLQWKPWYLYLGHWWQRQASVGSPFHLLVSLSVCSIGRAAAHSHPRKKRNASVEARNFPFQRCWVFQECLVSRCTVYVDRGLRLRVQRICSFGAVYWHGDTSSITELPNRW